MYQKDYIDFVDCGGITELELVIFTYLSLFTIMEVTHILLLRYVFNDIVTHYSLVTKPMYIEAFHCTIINDKLEA